MLSVEPRYLADNGQGVVRFLLGAGPAEDLLVLQSWCVLWDIYLSGV